jgi:DNA-binding transcriptional ArsR family regulator
MIVRNGGVAVNPTFTSQSLEEKSMRPAALRLLSFLSGLPDGSHIGAEQLPAALGISRNTVYRALARLTQLGYCTRFQGHDDGGRFKASEYGLHDPNQGQNPHDSSTSEQNLSVGRPTAEPVERDSRRLLEDVIANPEDQRWFIRKCIAPNVMELRSALPKDTYRVLVEHLARIRAEVA